MKFYMVYQPQFQDSKIVSLEALLRPEDKSMSIDDFIYNQTSKVDLDINVIKKVVGDLKNNQLIKSVSINIHPSSLLSKEFIDNCIKLCSNQSYKVVLELIEYETYEISQNMIQEMNHLRELGIELAIDDFGKNFSNADTLIHLPISKVKIDGSLVDNIESNSLKFKFLNFLNGIILDIVHSDVVFEKVETLRQVELIQLINPDAIIQGYYYEKPITIEQLMTKYNQDDFKVSKQIEKNNQMDLFDLVFDYVKHNIDVNDTIYSQKVNDIFKKHDMLKLTHNTDFDISWDNFRDSFLSRSCNLKNQFIRMINTEDRLVVVRNSLGVVVFDNITHINTIGASLVGINPKDIICSSSEYSMCILRDNLFLESSNSFEVSQEYYGPILYEIIREKIHHNNETFVMCSIYKSDTGIEAVNNKVGTFSAIKESYDLYLNKKALIVTFKDSSSEVVQELNRKIFNLYVLGKAFKLKEGKFIFIPNNDIDLIQAQLDIITNNNSEFVILNKEQIILSNDIDIEKYL